MRCLPKPGVESSAAAEGSMEPPGWSFACYQAWQHAKYTFDDDRASRRSLVASCSSSTSSTENLGRGLREGKKAKSLRHAKGFDEGGRRPIARGENGVSHGKGHLRRLGMSASGCWPVVHGIHVTRTQEYDR